MTGGRRGLPTWLIQRTSAVFLAGYTVFLSAHFAYMPPASYAAWRTWLNKPGVEIGMMLFFLALILHTWVGLRNVIMDYVHAFAWRLALLMLMATALGACAVWALRIVLVSA